MNPEEPNLFVNAADSSKIANAILVDQEVAIPQDLLSDPLNELHLGLNTPLSLKEDTNVLTQVEIFYFLAPYRKLPPEILTEIFALCIPATGVTFPPDYKSAPWSLGRVCSTWRHLVFTEPQIWLHVRLLYQFKAVHRNRLNLFTHTFMRARRMISLQVVISPREEAMFTYFIISHSANLEDLSISLRHPSSFPFLSLPAIQFRNLKSLVVRLPPNIQGQGVPMTVFNNTPNLRKLEFQTSSGHYISFNSFPIQLCFSHLTELIFVCIDLTPHQLCSLLCRCPALVVGTFCLFPGPLPRLFPPTINVPSLRTATFHLANYGMSLSEALFSFLTLPVLESLTIFASNGKNLPEDIFHSFLRRSSCSLQAFEAEFPMDDRGVEFLLREAPTLREIKLMLSAPISAKIIQVIIDENLVPELEIFHFGTECINAALDLMVDRWSTSAENGGLPKGIWEAVIGYGQSVADQDEGLRRYCDYGKQWLWDQERRIQMKYVK